MKTQDAIVGFAALTSYEVKQQWDRKHGHRHVAVNHAWKYNGNQPQANPELLDLPLASAILTTGNHEVKEGKVVRKLRTKIKTAQEAAAEAKKALPTARRGRQVVAPKVAAPVASTNAGAVVARPTRARRQDGDLSRMISERGGKSAIVRACIANAAIEYGITLPGMPAGQAAAELADWGAGDHVQRLARLADAARSRAGITGITGMSIAVVLLEAVDPVNAGDFLKTLNIKTNGMTPGEIAVRRIAGATKEERTPHLVADYILQAWDAHATGRPLTHFVDRAELTMPKPYQIKTAQTCDTANDNCPTALSKAA